MQGGSLRTWSYRSAAVERVQVDLSTEGRPLDAVIELWRGPDNTPCQMRVYTENGSNRPFRAVIESPRGPNTVAIRNVGLAEFPFAADVVAEGIPRPSAECIATPTAIQGGGLRTFVFDPMVDSVEVLLRTDGRPLNARIELLQGPNENKQVVELYTEDGRDRPFFCILESPGSGNVVRIVNTAPVEYPMTASCVPHTVNLAKASDLVLGGDVATQAPDVVSDSADEKVLPDSQNNDPAAALTAAGFVKDRTQDEEEEDEEAAEEVDQEDEWQGELAGAATDEVDESAPTAETAAAEQAKIMIDKEVIETARQGMGDEQHTGQPKKRRRGGSRRRRARRPATSAPRSQSNVKTKTT